MAQLDKSTLVANLDANINTNGNQLITGAVHNAFLHDMIDSIPNLIDDVNLLGTTEYDGTITYGTGDSTIFEGILYQGLQNGITGAFDSTKWEKIAGQSTAWQDPVIDLLTAPPGGESEGDRYLIDTGASGTWNNKDGQIAEWTQSAWRYTIPEDGWKVTINDVDDGFFHHEGVYSTGVFAWVKQFSTLNGSGTANRAVKWVDSDTLTDAPWKYVTNALVPVADGYDIGDATNGAGTLYMTNELVSTTLADNQLWLNDGSGGITLSIDALNYNHGYLGMWDGATDLTAGVISSASQAILSLMALESTGSVASQIEIRSDETTPANSQITYQNETSHRFVVNTVDTVLINSSGLSIETINGIDINPGSDVDADLLTVGVTDNPRLFWDESGGAVTLTNDNNNATFNLDAPAGKDVLLGYYILGTQKSRIQYDESLNTLTFIIGGGGISDAVMGMLPDGEIKIYNQGETNQTVLADTVSHWVMDANGAGTCSPYWETEDGTTIVLAATSLMTNLWLSGYLALEDWHYFIASGNTGIDDDDNFRQGISGGNLLIQKRISGAWVTQSGGD